MERIQEIPSLLKFKLTWSDFEPLFLKIYKEVNVILEGSNTESNPINYSHKKTKNEKEILNFYEEQYNISSENLKGKFYFVLKKILNQKIIIQFIKKIRTTQKPPHSWKKPYFK